MTLIGKFFIVLDSRQPLDSPLLWDLVFLDFGQFFGVEMHSVCVIDLLKEASNRFVLMLFTVRDTGDLVLLNDVAGLYLLQEAPLWFVMSLYNVSNSMSNFSLLTIPASSRWCEDVFCSETR